MNRLWTQISELARRETFGPALIACVATLSVLCTLDPGGDYPGMWTGPGLTVDEIFNADFGARLADRIYSGDVPGAIRVGQTLPDHPPGGRLWMGLFHELCLIVWPPPGKFAVPVVAAARVGSAFAFGLLLYLIGSYSARWFGRTAGWTAALSLAVMPRVFGHAHLASLETILNLTYTLTILRVGQAWSGAQAPNLRTILVSGVCLGLALLTKIQAVFLPIPIGIWLLWNWRWKSIGPAILWGLTGVAVFFAGWTWLWRDPIRNLLKFLGHASDRSTIQVWYFGQLYTDKSVPWHYPWVIFAVTVPLGLLLLGLWGAVSVGAKASEPTANTGPVRDLRWLLVANVLFPLFVFSVPGVSVYDGERLFLIVYPLWAMLVGRGCAQLETQLWGIVPAKGYQLLLITLLGVQSLGIWQLAPCWLSHYSALVGGIRGATRLGLQTTYWGDGITRELWQQVADMVPPGETVDVVPVLHEFQPAAYESQTPALRNKEIRLRAYREESPAKYLVFFARRDYLPSDWISEPVGYRRVAAVVRQGVVLAGLYERLDEERVTTP